MSEEDIQKDLVSYRQLQELEDDFEEVEVELLRHQTKLTSDLYAKRAKVIASVPGFWPLVMEQAPADIDDYISPSDAALLNNALVDLSVERFELADGGSGSGSGDPRSIAIRMTFAENDHFAAQTLEKRFWWRHARDGWSGLVSEPVAIAWKSPDKDLTGGLLDLACRLRQAENAAAAADAGGGNDAAVAEAKKALLAQMEDAGGEGGVSFFAFFGFCGRRVSVEESVEAKKVEEAKRAEIKAGKHVEDEDEDDDDDDDDDDDGLGEYETEIFPTADDVAVSIAEDLYPNAIKYFITAQEQDALSDMDFEEMDDEDDEEMVEVNGDDKSSKKRKA